MSDVTAWVDSLARELPGADALSPAVAGALLRITRDVAHSTERFNAPLCAYVAGRHVARRVAAGVSEEQALGEVEPRVRLAVGSG